MGRDAALASAHFRHDAVGAHLVAALLNLDHGARSGGAGADRLDVIAGGARNDVVSRPVDDVSHESRLLGIAQDEIDLVEAPQGLRRALGVASRRHDGRIWMVPPRGAERPTRLRVGDVSDGAAVQHVYVNGYALAYDLEACIGELRRQTAGVGLVELAAVRLDGHSRLWL